MDKTCLQCLGLLESPSVPGGEECSCTVSSVLPRPRTCQGHSLRRVEMFPLWGGWKCPSRNH